jgi:hypothetical protein
MQKQFIWKVFSISKKRLSVQCLVAVAIREIFIPVDGAILINCYM